VTNISPRYAPVEGGSLITFTGQNFVTDVTRYTILLDGVNCQVQSASSTKVTCITGKRTGLIKPSLSFYINNKGYAFTGDLTFKYAAYWSNPLTWGSDFPPVDGDSIVIPEGLNLLVDIAHSPLIDTIDVEGTLIFAPDANPNAVRTFDFSYMMINGGTLEIGTEDFPYTSKLVLTMHGLPYDPELPMFGNKVIALYEGTIDIHGIKKLVYTELNTTARPLDIMITLNAPIDWSVGDQIAIAPTFYDGDDVETRTIVAIDNTNPNLPRVTLDKPLVNTHYAGTDTFQDGNTFTARAEVARITRNVVIQGDPATSQQYQHGGQLFAWTLGNDIMNVRIENA
jgi:G8 domain/IPT/TIG domain